MSLEPHADARRWRLIVLVCLALLTATLAAAGVHALAPGWQKHQRDFSAMGAVPKDRALGIVQSTSCTGEVDRCETCHLGAARKDLKDPRIVQPLRAHSIPLEKHLARSVGCADCHGGSGRALEASVAHAFPGDTARDAMLKEPHIEASCARCHVPGDYPGMEHLVHGARIFGEVGCAICHPLSGEGRGGWDFGPDLRAGGRKSVGYLETSLTDPAANFPDSTMPSFAMLQRQDKAGFTDLIVFLESLELPRARDCGLQQRSDHLARMPCASCHAGPAGKASGRMPHRCLYLLERRPQLTCGGCHREAIPGPVVPAGEPRPPVPMCPVEREHRAACAACHDDFTGSAR